MATRTDPVTETPPKILVEFSLTPESKAKLQTFLDKNFWMLKLSYPLVKDRLHKVIEENFPKESLKEIQNILHEGSEYATLVRNCPERTGFEHKKSPQANDSYSYYLGKALYEMFDIEHYDSVLHTRRSHLKHTNGLTGGDLHRDIMAKKHGLFPREVQRSMYVIFSSPHNEEHAVTEVVNVRASLESIPQAEREKTFVDAAIHDPSDRKRTSLETIYKYLMRPIKPDEGVCVKKIYTSIWNEETSQWEVTAPRLLKAMEASSVKVDLQPGDLLIFDQHSLFHQAHFGDVKRIERIPKHHLHSRMVIHSAGCEDRSK